MKLKKVIKIFILCLFNFGFVSTQSVSTNNPQIQKNVGDNADLVFITNVPSADRNKVKSFYVELNGVQLASGVFNDFRRSSAVPADLSSRLIVAPAEVSTDKQTYTLRISNLNINDTKFYNATLAYTDEHVLTRASIYLDVRGGPYICGASAWPSSLKLMEGESNVVVETIACGNPQPTIIFKLEGINNNLDKNITTGYQHQYIYTSYIPTVMPSFCGRNISYRITGYDTGVVLEDSSKINVSFAPPTPVLINAYLDGSCTKSSWNPVDIGNCDGIFYHVSYLKFDNSSLMEHTVAMGNHENTFCNDTLVSEVTAVKLRTSRGSMFSQWDFIEVNYTQGTWGPFRCSSPIPNPINVDGASNNNNFNLILCGNPKPELTFTLDGSPIVLTTTHSTTKQQHMFVNTFPSITASMCNKTFTYNAVANGNTITETSIISGSFLPPKVSSISAYRESVCTYVSWSSVDYGKCSGLYYEIAYVLSNGSLTQRKNVSMETLNDTYCVNVAIENITHAQVRSIVGGRYSDWSRNEIAIQSVLAAIKIEEDDNWPLILGLIIGFSLFLLLLIFLAICWRCRRRRKEKEIFQSVRRSYKENKTKKSSTTPNKNVRKTSQHSKKTKGKTNYGYNETDENENNTRKSIHVDISAPIIETDGPATLSYNGLRMPPPSKSENLSFSNRTSQETLSSYDANLSSTSFQSPKKRNDSQITYLYNNKNEVMKPKVYGQYLPPEHFEMDVENV